MSAARAIAVFGSSSTAPGSHDWITAEDVGGRIARAGLAVVTGGYGGTMEAASKGAADAGGHVIGVTAPSLFPGRSEANSYVTELIEATGLMDRIDTLIASASGALALPGSIGTATELLVAWNVNYLARRGGGKYFPIAAIGEEWAVISGTIANTAGANLEDVFLAPDVDSGLSWLAGQLEILQI